MGKEERGEEHQRARSEVHLLEKEVGKGDALQMTNLYDMHTFFFGEALLESKYYS